MSAPPAGPLARPTPPVTARALRAALRHRRRRHREGGSGEFLTDVYMFVLAAAMYGWAIADTIAGYVAPEPGAPVAVGARRWLTMAALVILAGAVWQALAALGPLFATPAAQTWALATPVSRRGWLAPRLVALLGIAAVAGALLGAAAGGLATVGALGWATLTGALLAPGLAAVAVAAQVPSAPSWTRSAGTAAMVTGAGGCAAVVGLRAAGAGVPLPAGGLTAAAAVAAVLAVAGVVLAVLALPRVDRASLTGGSQVATAVAGAATLLDPTMVTEVLAVRRWRRLGRVTTRRWRPGPRWWLLLQAEIRRLGRRPSVPVVWGVLALAPYAVALVAPSLVDAVRIVACYLAVDRLAGGLRTISRSAPLRRALGGDDTELRIAHLLLPAFGLSLWWALTEPAAGGTLSALSTLLALGVLGAVYRAAGRRPISYSGTAVDTPFGLLPLDLLRQLFRGPDVLAVVLLVNAVAGG